MKKAKPGKTLLILSLVILSLLVIWRLSFLFKFPSVPQFGVTFSSLQTKELGLQWKEVYLATLDELNVKKIRLPVYWDEIEKKQGQYDFADLDWKMFEAQKRDAKIILAIGQRVPRWPECHRPAWEESATYETQKADLRRFLELTVLRYKNNPALEIWQVENEPFLNIFGNCPVGDKKLLDEEIALVRKIDPKHKVMVTDSGELSFWFKTAKKGDYFGTSVYRSVETFLGQLSYKYIIPPLFYRAKAWLVGKPIEQIFVSELQAEPWTRQPMTKTSVKVQEKSFNLQSLNDNIAFSRNLGFPRVYLWGVEWWYWKKLQGDNSYWTTAQALFPA